MRHPQLSIEYFPKKENKNEWQTTSVELSGYLDFQSEDGVDKKKDAAQVPFILKSFDDGTATYAANVFTISSAKWKVNQWRWFMLVDANNNRFRIASNTLNTITLSTDYTFPGVPVAGWIKIMIPDFQLEDELDFYVWNIDDGVYAEPAADADKLAFVGQIIAISDKYDVTQGAQRVVKFNNLTEALLSYNIPAAYPNDGSFKKFYEKISNVLDFVAGSSSGTLSIVEDASNPVLKKDGSTAFPDIDYYSDYKSSYEIVYDLCQAKYTEDGEYYFFIKPSAPQQYTFMLRPKLFTGYADLEEGEDFSLISRSIDKADAISRLIIKCGLDPDGKRVSVLVQGNKKYGTRGRPVAHNFAGDIMQKEILTNTANFDTELEEKSLYPTAYNYVTATIVTAAEYNEYPGYLTVGANTITTDKEYRTFVRWLSRAKAKIWGRDYINHTNNKREKVVIRYYNVPTSAIPGDIKRLKIPSIGWTGGAIGSLDYRIILRITSRKTNISKKGITVDVEYLQDWELSQ